MPATTTLVAAIDIGYSRSSYAFSTSHDYRCNPFSIKTNRSWNDDAESSSASLKTSSAILFNKDMSFRAYGFEAESQYRSLCDSGEQQHYPFFLHFKYLLRTPHLDRNSQADSMQGIKANALTVYSASIKYLKEHLLDCLKDSFCFIEKEDIQWVLTVPVASDDYAKQFVHMAAQRAGIPEDRLLVALEEKVISLNCKEYSKWRRPELRTTFSSQATTVILNFSDGSSETEIYEVTKEESIKGFTILGSGESRITEEFNKLMQLIAGQKTMENFHREYPEESVAFINAWEYRKLMIKPRGDHWITFNLPHSLLGELRADRIYLNDEVKLVRDKIRFRHSFLAKLFQPTIDLIVLRLEDVITRAKPEKDKNVFVVGELSSSEVVLDALKTAFADVTFIVPYNPALVTLIGAVLYGHDPTLAEDLFDGNEIADDLNKLKMTESTTSTSSTCDTILVAAIDFGTTYSGWAYTTTAEYKQNPSSVNCNRLWSGRSESDFYYKAPTSVLFRKDMTFQAFGYDAEYQYMDKCANGTQNDFKLFRHFKLLLHSNTNPNTKVKGEDGAEADAISLFSESIRFLKGDLLQILKDRFHGIEQRQIQWVLTVPAIWDAKAKQFMRDAATKAGIDSDRLLIALEPEAASIYCRQLQMIDSTNREMAKKASEPNTEYMTIDIGGGTVDITIHETSNDNLIKELTKPSGGIWGGLKVDEVLKKLVESIYGQEVWTKFCSECPDDSFQLTKTLEHIKCRQATENQQITFDLPPTLKNMFTEKTGQKNPEKYQNDDKIVFSGYKARISSSLLDHIYRPVIQEIVNHLKALREKPSIRQVKYAFLVGGLANSRLLVKALRTSFKDLIFIEPEDKELVVLRGAVLYGHSPTNAIAARRSAFTYGFETHDTFDQKKHSANKKVTIDGIEKCEDIFDRIIEEDQLLLVDENISIVYTPLRFRQERVRLTLYKTLNKDATYITDVKTVGGQVIGVEKVGELIVHIPDTTGEKDRKIRVNVRVGGTELEVDAVDPNSQKHYKKTFEFAL